MPKDNLGRLTGEDARRAAAQFESEQSEVERLRAKLRKVVGWLEGQARHNEREAGRCSYETLRQAYIADAKNYRATIKDIMTVLPLSKGDQT